MEQGPKCGILGTHNQRPIITLMFVSGGVFPGESAIAALPEI